MIVKLLSRHRQLTGSIRLEERLPRYRCARWPIAALVLLAVWTARSVAGDIDPRLIGAWELQAQQTPFNQGYRSILEFRVDGTYTFHDLANGHAGTFTASEGRWSVKSNTVKWQDGGDYALPSDDVLKLTGLFEPSEWHRVTDQPFFAVQRIGGQPIPIYLPLVLAQTWLDVAKPWRQDAIPVWLQIERWDKNAEFFIRMRFLSPSTRDGLVVDAFRFQRNVTESRGVDWPSRAMPFEFVDLPRVIELSTQAGRPGTYKRFSLSDAEPGWGWGIVADRMEPGNLFFVTQDGRVERHKHWGYLDYYEERWNRAAASLHSLFSFGSSGGTWGDPYWRMLCQQAWAGSGGGIYDPATNQCH